MLFSVEQSVRLINKKIESFNFGSDPQNLYDPIRYIMGLGGKRLRPVLVLLSHHLFPDDQEEIFLPAIGVEVFHNFTLMHDDIMDQAPLRRGKPTVHEKWNTNVAILSGDVMLVKAYELFLNVKEQSLNKVLQSFNKCAAEVCEGQQLDVNYEALKDVTLAQYIHMITLKTAVLLGFSMELGGIIGDAGEKNIKLLKGFGTCIGIAFQLKDDLLDVFGDQSKFGKKVGGDILSRKKTFLLIKALELAKGADLQFLKSFIKSEKLPDEKDVEMVTTIYTKLNLREVTDQEIRKYFTQGIEFLSKVDAPLLRKKTIKTFVANLMERET